MGGFIDISGKRYGQLVAVTLSEGYWNCKCDCGEPTRARTAGLRRGKRTSCGCSHFGNTKSIKKISGQTFGMLKAQADTPETTCVGY